MGLGQIVRFIVNHPLGERHKLASVGRFVRWQLATRMLPGQAVVSYANDARLLVSPGMTGATGNIYVGLHEFDDMAFVAHALRADDLFVDVGANVGSYSILAAKVAGARCLTLEPIPATFQALMDNVRLNALEARVDARCIAAGAKSERLRATSDHDTANRVCVAGNDAGATLEVGVEPLDALLDGEQPVVIKLDVEGFELAVLEGARKTLARESLRALVVETNGSGRAYGRSDDELHACLLAAGFTAYRYAPFERRLSQRDGYNAGGNTLYLREPEWVAERVRTAAPIRVLGEQI